MIRYSLAAAATIMMMTMTGLAVAQTSSSVTSTQSMTSTPVPVPNASSIIRNRQTTDSTGVVTDETQTYTNNTGIAPPVEQSTTRKTTETTISR